MFSRFELLQGAVSYLLLSGAQHRAESRLVVFDSRADRSRAARSLRDNSTRRIYSSLLRSVAQCARARYTRLDVNIVTRPENAAAAWQISNLDDYLRLLMTGRLVVGRSVGQSLARLPSPPPSLPHISGPVRENTPRVTRCRRIHGEIGRRAVCY